MLGSRNEPCYLRSSDVLKIKTNVLNIFDKEKEGVILHLFL